MVDRIQQSTRWFCGEMRKKLRENEHKRGWDDCSIHYLIGRLHQEIYELHNEIFAQKKDSIKIVREAADVANFCMMIAEKFKHKPKED